MSRAEVHRLAERVERALYRAVCLICVLLLGAIVLTVSAAVFARFIIFTPLNFADPLSKYLMQWMAFLGIGLALKRGEHVLVDAFASLLGPTARRILALVIALLVAVLFAVVLRHGITNALSARTSSDPFVFGVPMVYPYFSVPAGAAYALAQAILTAVMVLTAPRGDDPLPHAIPKGI